MPFLIEDFLDLDIVKGAKLRTENTTIHQKPIDSISAIELPVEDFVHKNELVLTTGIGCENDEYTFLNFVRDVYNSQATGMVISIGRYIKSIPESVIEYANSINFPIIEMPWEIRFAGVIETVLSELHSKRHSNVKTLENIQRKLLSLYLDGSTLFDAANLIYKELGNQVIMVNSLGTIRGASPHSEELLDILEAPLSVLLSGKDPNLLKRYDPKGRYKVYKISSRNIVYGYLYLKTGDNTSTDIISDNKVLVSRHIVSILSLWFEREQTIYETEMHHKDKFVWNLIQGDDNELRELYTQAQSIGYDLSKPYICIIGRLSNLNKSYKLYRSNFSSYEEWEFNCVKSVKSQILRINQTIDQEIMLTYQKERLIIFLEATDSDLEKQANDFIDIVENSVKPLYPELILSWGIGVYKTEYPNFNKAYLDAKISLEFGQNNKSPGFRYAYHNTSIYRLLSILLEDSETIDVVTNIIGQLVQHDNEGGLDLLNTFKAYTENKGNVSKTARKLHLHRQSLLYRLKRIEEITQMSLDNGDDIFLLELCVRLWDKKDELTV